MINVRCLLLIDNLSYPSIAGNKSPQLVPFHGTATVEIEHPSSVLANGRNSRAILMEPLIMADNNPVFLTDHCKPSIIVLCLIKSVLLLIVEFDLKWRA